MAINTDAERAVLYKEFCEWCYTVPYLELDPRLHTHGGRIEDGGYISNGVTAKAFAAWKAARCAPAAPQPQADGRDAQRYRWLIDYFISDRVDLDDAIVAAKTSEDIAKIIDAAIAAAKEMK
jgi:hypothetical protein